MTARFIVGDVFDVMATIPDGSVDLVLTSPPFLALRSYLPADHPQKHLEIGSEPTPAAFLDTLLALSAEWRRVLAPHGSICVELGDTYSGSGGAGGDCNADGLRAGQERFDGSARRGRNRVADDGRPTSGPNRGSGNGIPSRPGYTVEKAGAGWPLAKSLCGIPTLYPWSLAYGRNLLTGQPSPAGMWRIRNLVAWCRPNPPVGALGDKVRPGTSYLTMACFSVSRYFDLDAIREPMNGSLPQKGWNDARKDGGGRDGSREPNPAGAPPLDHWWYDDVFDQDAWLIPTEPYKGSHYATWPPALCTRPILAMCPQRVCVECGKASTRIVEADRLQVRRTNGAAMAARSSDPGFLSHGETNRTTLGWSDCGHNAWRPGLVLDCFGGSGTTGAVATGHGRDCLLIDIDARNADLAQQRIGMFLTVEHFSKEGAA